ncbi:MAG: hypothetical protein ISR65_16225 [Bacteriovoracaceae bacterium]|nr:hypothetical protein [Bacteriovoracaceae bacterium]
MKKTSKLIIYLIVVGAIYSCTLFTAKIDDQSVMSDMPKGSTFSIIFSHNINGETHPCGCRHFPLGGLPQAAGVFSDLKSNNLEYLYVDIGDTFFPSVTVPKPMEKSLTFGAKNLLVGLNKIGLKVHVPGDQDFAAGMSFYKELVANASFDILVSNLKNEKLFKHKPWIKIERGINKIYLVGFVYPWVLPQEVRMHFLPINGALEKVVKDLERDGYQKDNPFHRLVVLSHSGMQEDQKIAKKYPFIDWFLGAHSQSFNRFAVEEGKTKLVQVLSRNHYLGHLAFSLDRGRLKDRYKIIEVRVGLEKNLHPNPFISFIDDHKINMRKIQLQEQESMLESGDEILKYNTSASCVDCHAPQVDFWRKTPHALAYQSLIASKEESNLQCVKCHSLGLDSPHGFFKADDIVVFESQDQADVKSQKSKYWQKLGKVMKNVHSVRKLNKNKLFKLSKNWEKLDDSMKVTHNYANVQCLNCHTQHLEHPFVANEVVAEKKVKLAQMKKKCLQCHTRDRSNGWYVQDNMGRYGDLKAQDFKKRFKEVSCPLRQH